MLTSSVLVLNKTYQPVHVTSVRRALTLLYAGVAKAIDEEYRVYEFADWAALSAANHEAIRTVGRPIRVPRVLVLSAYERLPRLRIRFSRANIYARDHDTCQYCARQLPRTELNLDHVVPRSQGGRTSWTNVVCSCIQCNLRKGGRTPAQARMKLLKVPVQPRWMPFFRGPFRKVAHREWLPFLSLTDASYWNVELTE